MCSAIVILLAEFILCDICSCVNSKYNLEHEDETWCVLGILQTMNSAQLNKGILSPLVHENCLIVERSETQSLAEWLAIGHQC